MAFGIKVKTSKGSGNKYEDPTLSLHGLTKSANGTKLVFLPTIDFGFGSGCNEAGNFLSTIARIQESHLRCHFFSDEPAVASIRINFTSLTHFCHHAVIRSKKVSAHMNWLRSNLLTHYAGLPQFQVHLKGKVFFEGTTLLPASQDVEVTVDLHEVRDLIRERLRGNKVRLSHTNSALQPILNAIRSMPAVERIHCVTAAQCGVSASDGQSTSIGSACLKSLTRLHEQPQFPKDTMQYCRP